MDLSIIPEASFVQINPFLLIEVFECQSITEAQTPQNVKKLSDA